MPFAKREFLAGSLASRIVTDFGADSDRQRRTKMTVNNGFHLTTA